MDFSFSMMQKLKFYAIFIKLGTKINKDVLNLFENLRPKSLTKKNMTKPVFVFIFL